jgi:tetratricopeptide (TPR) repeat protein
MGPRAPQGGGALPEAREALRQALELAPEQTDLYWALSAVYEREKNGAKTSVTPAPAAAPLRFTRALATRLDLARTRELGLLAALGVAALFVVGLLARGLRGRGDLAVAIEYGGDRRGTFTVRLDRRRRRRASGDPVAAPEGARASSRFEHNMISRETQFRGVPARTYWVALEGFLEETSGNRRRSAVLEEREVWLERGRAQRVEFDLRPRVCPIEVRVVDEGVAAPGARVSLAGDPTSLRYARDGVARLSLPAGQHRLLAASRDRVAEHELPVEDLTAKTVVIDLGEAGERVFSDCEAAVEPYLQGDLSVAAAALERAGQTELAHHLRARFHRARGELDRAAAQYEASGRLVDAAEAWCEAAGFEQAAELFERAGDPTRAAEMYDSAGDLLRAGRAYEEAGAFDSAAHCYRAMQAVPKLINVLEKQGDCYEAGQLALADGDVSRAMRNFQQVDARHERYPEVCRLLAERLSEQGKLELAVQKADEAITFSGADEASPDTFAWYGDLLERAGKTERALRTFEELRERSPEHPDVAARIENLEKKLSGERRSARSKPSGERYEVVRELGRGGMGVVYEVRDKRLGRTVALKRLPENLKDHPRAVELFLREARSAAALNHANIVTVHDVDQDDQGFFLTMELLEGQALNEILKTKSRVAPRDTARLGLQVATGLQYAHERRIIHRDIKTANLFFTRERVVKIMDFGLAKMLEEVRRASTVIGGTPFYMAPEQATGEPVDHRADLYSFGVTLFELLTGRVPFADGDVTYRHRHEAPPDPRTLKEGLPDPICELVLELMAKEPEARPAAAALVAVRLQRIAEEPT